MKTELGQRWRLWIAALGAMVFCTLLYKYTLRAWFQADDFAWLGLRLQVHNAGDFWHAMFAPMAGGSIRPLSERAFFMGFYSLFGIHALPYRIAIYVTQLGVILLLTVVAQRLSKSYAAAFVASILWVANSALAYPLTWTCAYNEILLSGVFLLAFYCLMRYVETGNARFNRWQWVAFLLGFGILEINVVYPLIAVFYVACFAPRLIKRMALLFIPSAIFMAVFFAVRIKPQNQSFYALGAGLSIFRTLAAYWNIALGPGAAAEFFPRFSSWSLALTLILSVAVLGFAAWRTARGDRIPIFCLGWFLIALAPFLPIYSHVTDYYITVPTIGLALLGGWAAAIGLKSGVAYRAVTLTCMAAYLALQIPTARAESKQFWARSMPLKRMVLGVEDVYERNPGKTILLDGVNEEIFWLGVYNRPFRLFGATDVLMTPETGRKIKPYPELGNVADYTLPETRLRDVLSQNRAVVYAVDDEGHVRDVTKLFQASTLDSELPQKIELGHPPLDSMLGSSWYPSEGDFRWMPKDATVRLGVPNGPAEVRVAAFCAAAQVEAKPLQVWLSIDGLAGPHSMIRDCNQPVALSAPLTPGNKEVEIGIHVDRTVRVGSDLRDLGLAVRSVEVAKVSPPPGG